MKLSCLELFQSYPYKRYQHRYSHVKVERLSPMQLSDFNAAKHKVCMYETNKTCIGLASLRSFHALSEWFGMQAFIMKDYLVREGVDKRASFRQLLQVLLETYGETGSVIMTRQPIDNVHGIKALMEAGFYFVCGEAIFSYMCEEFQGCTEESPWESAIQVAHEADLEAVYTIAKDNHHENRYLYDDFFDKDKVRSFFAKVIQDSYHRTHESLLVCRIKGEVIGFITVIYNEKMSDVMGMGYGSMDYIAIKETYETKGLGEALNRAAIQSLIDQGVRFISVKTLSSNYKAIGLLMRSGFRLTSQNVILHKQMQGTKQNPIRPS